MFATPTVSSTEAPTPSLNQGQREAAEGFYQFLFSEDKEMIISGPGGVGKTFLMGYLIDQIMPRYFETCQMLGIKPEYDEVVMTATTNKAAEALGEATKRPTKTIHSFLNLKVQDDYVTGESKLVRTGAWTVHTRKIIFIDEAGMIDTPLETATHEGTHKCKIVYVGDHCQLSPVKETLSPIYRRGLPFYELTEPMRNSGQPALMALCQQLRRTIETGIFNPIRIVPGVIDLLDEGAMQTELTKAFAQQTHESRILAYTNARVVAYNDFVRQQRGLTDEFTNGEFLVCNTAFHAKTRMISVEEEVEIASQKAHTEMAQVAPDATLEVRRTDLRSRYGEVFRDVPVPVDRAHYDALVKYYQKQKNWTRYFHLKNTYPDLRQRDAATVHKSQGSTYDSVFIDLGNISTCNIPNQVARLLYVAVSRPKNRIFLFGDLAQKYGGLVH